MKEFSFRAVEYKVYDGELIYGRGLGKIETLTTGSR